MFFKNKNKEGYGSEQENTSDKEDLIPSGVLEIDENEEYGKDEEYEVTQSSDIHSVDSSSGMSGGFSADSQDSYEAGTVDPFHSRVPPIRSSPPVGSSPPIRSSPPEVSSSFSVLSESPDAIVMEFRKLDAKINSIVDWIKQFYERFSPVVNSMGKLRSMAYENEENINKALKDSARAIELASKMDLEKLRLESRKLDMGAEANRQEINRLSEEIRDLNERAQVFVSTEELLKLNEDVKNNLIQIKRIDSEIRERADRIDRTKRESGSALELKKEMERSEALIQRTAILAKQNKEALGNFTFEDYQEKIDTILEVIEKLAQEVSGVKKELNIRKEELDYKSLKKKNEVIEALGDIGEIPELPELPSPKIKKVKKTKRKR